MVSAGAAERYDSDYLQKMLPADGSVALRNVTDARGCFVLAGPRSRDVLAKLTDAAARQRVVSLADRRRPSKSGSRPTCTRCA